MGFLALGLWQKPRTRLGAQPFWQWFANPVEINPAAARTLVPPADLHALWFFDPLHGLAAGESGTLMRTNDGGASWQRAELDNRSGVEGLYALGFEPSGSGTGHLAGRSGTFFKSPDFGQTWQRVPLILTNPAALKQEIAAATKFAGPKQDTAKPAYNAPQAPSNVRIISVQGEANQVAKPPPAQAQVQSPMPAPTYPSPIPPPIPSDINAVAYPKSGNSLYLATGDGLLRVIFGGTNLVERIGAGHGIPAVAAQGNALAWILGGAVMVEVANAPFSLWKAPANVPRSSGGFEVLARSEAQLMAVAAGEICFAGVSNPEAAASGLRPRRRIPGATDARAAAFGNPRAAWIVGTQGQVWRVENEPSNQVIHRNFGTAELDAAIASRPISGFPDTLYAVWAFSADVAVVAGENALKPFPLVIFVDDLDRCDVSKVFQILEAINYLVSSGDCFVVLGMSEERVRDSVALGFKELPADFGEVENVVPTQSAAALVPGWSRQRELALNYLEKLVQLRVEVPRPKARNVEELAATNAARRAAAEINSWKNFCGWFPGRKFQLLAAAFICVALAGAFMVGRNVAPLIPAETETTETAPPPDNAPASSRVCRIGFDSEREPTVI